jgi:hypothetical protein
MNLQDLRRLIGPGILIIGLFIAIFLSGCSDSPVSSGGGTRGGNPVVTGMIIGLDGNAASNVKVSLIPSNYNPVTDTPITSTSIVLTDTKGTFTLIAPDSGTYSVEAVNARDGSRLLRFNVATFHDSTSRLSSDTLHTPGLLKIVMAGNTTVSNNYLYIPGTYIKAFISSGSDTLTIDSVPATTLPVLISVDTSSKETKIVQNNIVVNSGNVTIVDNVEKSAHVDIVLNTAQDGAGILGDLFNFPVLVRLNSTNFNFKLAKNNGIDLLFTRQDKITLPFEVERWDATEELAEIWVKIDTIYGNNSTQSITMSWGTTEQSELTGSAVTFDTAAGFQGVWHLGEAVGGMYNDATVNKYHGISSDTSLPETSEGMIGNCAVFNGKTDFITMPNTADSKLNFPESGSYTVCAWARIDTLDGTSHCIVSKGFEQYYLRSTYISLTSRSTPLWEFVEFSSTDKWQTLNTQATEKEWAFLVCIRDGKKQYLYCNGVLVDSTVELWPNVANRNTGNDLYIGRFAEEVNIPLEEGIFYFKGGIDEVRIMNKVEKLDWIKLCYMNQKKDDRLVDFKK